MTVKTNSNVPECCGLVNMKQYLTVLKQRDSEKSQISPLNRPKISPRPAEVVSACSKTEKEQMELNTLVLLYSHQMLFVHKIQRQSFLQPEIGRTAVSGTGT